MVSFLSLMNHLKLPINPIALDVNRVEFSKKAFRAVCSEISSMFRHLEHDSYSFKLGVPKKSHLHRVGVVFSGGPAAGGHNVIWGIFSALKQINQEGLLIGFLNGPLGIIENHSKTITEHLLKDYINTGGFDLLGSGRTKIETQEQLLKSYQTIKHHQLEALIIIGGDDSNTNAAVLGHYLKENKSPCVVVGVPKTIDGDLKNEMIETSFGFDSASKLFSELTGNIARDCLSAKKYTHFIKIMGRSASHLALEVALNARPNLTLISEEILKKKQSLFDIVNIISDLVIKRHQMGKNYGVIVIPEGLIEALYDMEMLVKNLSLLIAKKGADKALSSLDNKDADLYQQLPSSIQKQLLHELDPHGNVQVSLIETEKLLVELVEKNLKAKNFKGKFAPISHFLGYEGRCCFPTYFDLIYSYHLGITSILAAKEKLNGFIVSIKNLNKHPDHWHFEAVPIIGLLHLETRKGKEKPVIKKALVDLTKPRFQDYERMKDRLLFEDEYQFLGPNQYFGPFDQIYKPPLILND
jgi:pyrophosphate--fructose-6-phosphate 1-phosphotransferase